MFSLLNLHDQLALSLRNIFLLAEELQLSLHQAVASSVSGDSESGRESAGHFLERTLGPSPKATESKSRRKKNHVWT